VLLRPRRAIRQSSIAPPASGSTLVKIKADLTFTRIFRSRCVVDLARSTYRQWLFTSSNQPMKLSKRNSSNPYMRRGKTLCLQTKTIVTNEKLGFGLRSRRSHLLATAPSVPCCRKTAVYIVLENLSGCCLVMSWTDPPCRLILCDLWYACWYVKWSGAPRRRRLITPRTILHFVSQSRATRRLLR